MGLAGGRQRTDRGYPLSAIDLRFFAVRLLLPAFLILSAFAIRAAALGTQSLWFDEGWSWHLAKLPLAEMAITTAGDRSPPLYYALLHVWIALAGENEFAMRFPSTAADIVTVALVIAFARALCPTPRTYPNAQPSAVLSGLLYALCPFAVWYAQETRMYALVAALCTASSLWLWLWLRAVPPRIMSHAPTGREPTWEEGQPKAEAGRRPVRHLAASAAALALASYCHYYAIFLLPAQFLAVLAVVLLGSRPFSINLRPVLHFGLAAACTLAALIPWLFVASVGFAYDDGFAFPLNSIDGRLLEWVRGLAGGGLARPLPEWWPWALGVATVCGALGFAIDRRWRALFVVLALVFGPLLVATAAVRVVYPYRSVFHARYLIYVVPAVCILFGGVVWAVQGRRWTARNRSQPLIIRRLTSALILAAPLMLLGALWLPLLHAYFTDPALARDDTRGAVKHVVEALAPGDVAIMSRDNFAVRYYWTRQWEATRGAPYDASSGVLLAAPDGLHGVLTDDSGVLAKLNAAQPQRVRLMLWQDDVVDPQRFVESSLWPNAHEIGEFNFAQIRLPLYDVVRRPFVPPAFTPVGILFGDDLVLKQAWQPGIGTAGDWFYTVLEWEPRRPIERDYKVFVHVLGPDGQPVFQSDRQPLNALLPMTRWPIDRPARDARAMVIPAELPDGRYRVVAGVYDPDSGARLPARDANGPIGDVVPLGEVEVVRR
jgi:hypothetical protein